MRGHEHVKIGSGNSSLPASGAMVTTSVSLAVFGVMAMFTLNVSMIPATLAGLPCFPQCFMTSLPVDIQAGVLFLTCLLVAVLIVDAKAVNHMFFYLTDQESKTPHLGLSGKLNMSTEVHAKFCKLLVAVNWAAANGVVCSGLKLSVANPLQSKYSVYSMSLKVAHDLVVGDLQLNPLVRGGQRWESAYGLVCASYLVLHFGFLVMRHSNFVFVRFLIGKGTLVIPLHILTMAFGGLFGCGLWPLACLLGTAHLMLLWLASRFVAHREVGKSGEGQSAQAAEKHLVLRAMALLFISNLLLVGYMFLIYVLGQNSIWSMLIIYSPITIFTLGLIRDSHSATIARMSSSSHGCGAKANPESEGVAERHSVPSPMEEKKPEALTGLLLCVNSGQLNAIDLLRLSEVCRDLMDEVDNYQIWHTLLAQQLQPMVDAFFDRKLPSPSKGKTWKQHYFQFRWSWKELAQQQTGRMLVQIGKQELSGRGPYELVSLSSLWSSMHEARPTTYGVYDVTDFSHRHPGIELHVAAGLVDATDLFEMNAHCDAAIRMLGTLAVPGLENLPHDQEIVQLHKHLLCRCDVGLISCIVMPLGLAVVSVIARLISN